MTRAFVWDGGEGRDGPWCLGTEQGQNCQHSPQVCAGTWSHPGTAGALRTLPTTISSGSMGLSSSMHRLLFIWKQLMIFLSTLPR